MPTLEMKHDKRFYRPKEAALVLGFCRRQIDYMIADGRLTARRYGKRVLIPAADIDRVEAEILRSDIVVATK